VEPRADNATKHATANRSARSVPGIASDALGSYLSAIGHEALLTADEEYALFARLHRLNRWRDDVDGQMRRMSADAEVGGPVASRNMRGRRRRHAALVAATDAVRRQIIESNLRLAVAIAKRFQTRGISLSDLVQEANVGLIRAVDRFDHERGVRFAAYAAWWIQQSVGLAIMTQARTIRLPAYLQERQRQLRRIAADAPATASVSELAEKSGMTAEQAWRALRAEIDTVSLDLPVSPESRMTVGEAIEDAQTPRPDESAERSELSERVERMLATVEPRARHILRLRYGFDDGVSRSLQEVGDTMQLSRERVRQIESSAFERLRIKGDLEVLREYAVS